MKVCLPCKRGVYGEGPHFCDSTNIVEMTPAEYFGRFPLPRVRRLKRDRDREWIAPGVKRIPSDPENARMRRGEDFRGFVLRG